MPEPLAYLFGRLIPTADAAVPLSDAGFVQGATVAEQLRTFGGKLFQLEPHLERLAHSLAILGIRCPVGSRELAEACRAVVEHNHRLIAPSDDLGLAIFVTPGPYRPLAAGQPDVPLLGAHTTPLAFELWADKYEHGESLATTSVAQVPAACWPRELKVRSRVHYYLADKQARERFPGARAVMLDEKGFVTETTTANILAVIAGQLVSPPHAKILPGISLAYVKQLAESQGMIMVERDLAPRDLAAADEVLLTATTACIVPVTRFDGQPIGAGKPGPVFQCLIAAWSSAVGVDIVAQACRKRRALVDQAPSKRTQ